MLCKVSAFVGDEIEPPEEGPYEVYRIIFDITFFFFVIVILLAIMQGEYTVCLIIIIIIIITDWNGLN